MKRNIRNSAFQSQENADHSKSCPNCGYDYNPPGKLECEICQTKLVDKAKKNTFKAKSFVKKTKAIPAPTKKKEEIQLYFKNKSDELINYVRKPINLNEKQVKELKKPINLIGLLVISFCLSSWLNYLFFHPSKKVNQNVNQANQQNVIPQGLFNYGGSPIFAPLVASGVNKEIEKHEGFDLRYTKPLDQDFSINKAIIMLLEGELSFVYSDRPLNDQEYQKANLRSIALEFVPLAIDGIVIYTNTSVPIAQLNQDQVAKIFSGKITNWNQIDPHLKNLPITPVIVSKNQVPGIQIEKTFRTYETSNYTLALRKVIGTPGAISFASASLVKSQQLIKMLALADGYSSNYVNPKVQGKLNLAAFARGSYPLTRRIYLIYRKDGSNDQKAAETLANYLKSAKGQLTIEKAGFVSIY